MRQLSPLDSAAAEAAPPEPRLSTGVKMFLILTLALLPLGLIALFASLQASRTADLEKAALLNVAANESARNLVAELAADRSTLRLVVDSLVANRNGTDICARAVEILRNRGDARVDFVIHHRNVPVPLCASGAGTQFDIPEESRFSPDPADILPSQKQLVVRITSYDGQIVAIEIGRAHV